MAARDRILEEIAEHLENLLDESLEIEEILSVTDETDE